MAAAIEELNVLFTTRQGSYHQHMMATIPGINQGMILIHKDSQFRNTCVTLVLKETRFTNTCMTLTSLNLKLIGLIGLGVEKTIRRDDRSVLLD